MIRRKEQKQRTHLLIVGMPRSGTSLLSSLLGAHSHISIINEDFGRTWLDSIGKQVVGNKLCVPRQIGWRKKRGVTMKILNRLGLFKLWPKSEYCIRDYLQLPRIKFITIHRENEDIRSSILRRGGITKPTLNGEVEKKEITEKEVDYTIKKGTRFLKKIEKKGDVQRIEFEDLLNNTEEVVSGLCEFLGVPYQEDLIGRGTRWNWMYPESKKGIDKSKL